MHISLEKASQLLINGHVVAVPTETVYGLAASISQPAAIERIFTLKNRPRNNPLIIHLSSASEISVYLTKTPASYDALTKAFWPGPLTLIITVNAETVPEQIRAGLSTAAFRIPSHPIAHELLKKTGPLVMPSANLSGKPSATRSDHVETDFGQDFPVLNGGVCQQGVESTILYAMGEKWAIVRLGALSAESFIPIIGYRPEVIVPLKNESPICPGQLYRHYAPKAKLHLRNDTLEDQEGVIVGFSDRIYPKASSLFSLGASSNPSEVAANLYHVLRNLDLENISSASVDLNIPNEGLWQTIAERLKKAANG